MGDDLVTVRLPALLREKNRTIHYFAMLAHVPATRLKEWIAGETQPRAISLVKVEHGIALLQQEPVNDLPARLMANVLVDTETNCWNWQRAKRNKGHGAGYSWMHVPGTSGQSHYAHFVFYTTFKGTVPEGLELDHLCRNRGCVNPDHLEPVTHAENMRRSGPATKQFCVRGHPKTPENCTKRPNGHRECRLCKSIWDRDYRARLNSTSA